MVVLISVFWIGGVAILGAAALVYRRPAVVGWISPARWGRELADRTNPILAALLIALAGTQAVFLIGLPMGWAAKAVEAPFDHPTFRWVYRNAYDDGMFAGAMKVLTKMGNIHEIRIACVIFSLALGLAWRRRFYIPPIVVLSTFILEKFSQKGLGKIIDRGHPPTTLGTYPSGGCGRLLSIYGVMIFLGLLLVPHLQRRWRIAIWSVFALAAWAEGFSRLYLSKHWVTDVIGGLIFGALLLLTVISATAALTRRLVPVPDGAETRRSVEPEPLDSPDTEVPIGSGAGVHRA